MALQVKPGGHHKTKPQTSVPITSSFLYFLLHSCSEGETTFAVNLGERMVEQYKQCGLSALQEV